MPTVKKSLPLRAKASSITNISHDAEYAIDGSAWARWASAWGQDPQWLQIDLGNPVSLANMGIVWSNWGRAADYIIELSTDGQSWKTVFSASGRPLEPLFDKIKFPLQKNVRHVRITGCLTQAMTPVDCRALIYATAMREAMTAPCAKFTCPPLMPR